MTARPPVILCIMDGWGNCSAEAANAVSQANTPVFDQLLHKFPNSQLRASEQAVGLPKGQPGNSEVGHLTIGSGRLIQQDLPRISAACESGALSDLAPLVQLADHLAEHGGSLHLTGLTSTGGVHAHSQHIIAIANLMAEANIPVWLHIITDGRDTLPQAAREELPAFLDSLPDTCRVASVTGRYFAMDRDNRWERTQAFYDVMVTAQAPYHAADAMQAVELAYRRGETDEFVTATCIDGYTGPKPDDGLLVANFRVDRIRQILRAVATPEQTGCQLPDEASNDLFTAGMLSLTPVADDLADKVMPLFLPPDLSNGLGETISKAGLTQLRVAETEKYPHVTFFFNGGRETAFEGEDRYLVNSPQVATYDLQPEMSAEQVLEAVLKAIHNRSHELIIVNFANPDMVGHTGDLNAAITAVQTVDQAVGQIVDATLNARGTLLLTADHGNCEVMWDEAANSPHTAHTTNLVPCVLITNTDQAAAQKLQDGSLADLAPTILHLLGVDKPEEMTGQCLIQPA